MMLMQLPKCAGLYPSSPEEQFLRDLAFQTFGIRNACFAEVHPGDPLWMILFWLFRPGLVKVYEC